MQILKAVLVLAILGLALLAGAVAVMIFLAVGVLYFVFRLLLRGRGRSRGAVSPPSTPPRAPRSEAIDVVATEVPVNPPAELSPPGSGAHDSPAR